MVLSKVSVIITCYNYGNYLASAIDSVLEQTYPEFEIILVDDGSTDSTEQVAGQYAHDSRLTYIRQDNAGQANAKNTGIKHASGEFIAFLDADDRWRPKKLEKQMECFKNEDVGVVYCPAIFIDENDKELPAKAMNPYLQPKRGKVTEDLFLDNFVPFSSSVVRRICLDKFGFFDKILKMGIDWDLWLKISTEYKFDFVDEHLFFYREGHAGQMSKNLEIRQQCSDHIMERFLSRYPNTVQTETVRKAAYYTFCNRGEYFMIFDKRKSYRFFFKAIGTMPFNKEAYKGIVKTFINYKLND